MSPAPAYTYRAYITRVIDGDTFEFEIDLGFKVFTRQHIRVSGFNAAEMNTPEGKALQIKAADIMNRAGIIVIRTGKSIPAQSFERYVADVYVDGVPFPKALRAA